MVLRVGSGPVFEVGGDKLGDKFRKSRDHLSMPKGRFPGRKTGFPAPRPGPSIWRVISPRYARTGLPDFQRISATPDKPRDTCEMPVIPGANDSASVNRLRSK